jgi:hypothetical protein
VLVSLICVLFYSAGFVKKSKAEKHPNKPKCPSSAFLVSVHFPHLRDISISVLILWFVSCSNYCFGVFLVLPGGVQEGVKKIRLALLKNKILTLNKFMAFKFNQPCSKTIHLHFVEIEYLLVEMYSHYNLQHSVHCKENI